MHLNNIPLMVYGCDFKALFFKSQANTKLGAYHSQPYHIKGQLVHCHDVVFV